MNSITIEPIANKVFGAVVSGVRLAALNAEEFATIHQAFLKYGFLVFHRQFLSEEEIIAFGKRFGELEFGGVPLANQYDNEDRTLGAIMPVESQRMRTNVGNETWHTDSTYQPISSKCGLLSAVIVPAEGGETELADMRAGYAALDQATKDRIKELSAYHSTLYSQANDLGNFPPPQAGTIYHSEAYLRPLVKTHPETGVQNLLIGRHAFGIPGLSRSESKTLLQSLVKFAACEPSRVYQHHWQRGDTLLWDNRALLHRARPYDYRKARAFLATRVVGDPDSELAYYPTDPEAQAGREALATELALLKQEMQSRH